MIWIWIGAGALLIAGLLYWQLILAEGSYLGPRVVGWIYDRAARKYDRIARYNLEFEDETIGRPLARRLRECENPLVLDVATGTGRLPLSLLRQEGFTGYIVGLDISRGMLKKAGVTSPHIPRRSVCCNMMPRRSPSQMRPLMPSPAWRR